MPEIKDYVKDALTKGYSEKEVTELFSAKGYSSKEISAALDSNRSVKKESNYSTEELTFMKKITLIISDPKGFFDKVQDDGIGKSMYLFLLVSLCIFAIGYAGIFLLSAFRGGYGLSYGFYGIIYYVFIFAFVLCLTFVYSGFAHFILRMAGGQGNYRDTYNALVYSIIPTVIFSIIPFIGLLSFIYSCFLMTFGFAKYHNISYGKAVSAVLVPVILVIAVLAFIVIYFFYSFY